jgi:O-antigen/teichoic acid export membrane protein
MSSLPSLKKNYALNTLLTGINILFPLVVLAYAARVLGPDSMGSFYFAAGLAAYFLVLSGGAIPTYGVREIGKVRGDPEGLEKLAGELALLNVTLTLGAAFVYAVIVLVTPRFAVEADMFLLVGLMIPLQALSVDFVFQGLERYGNLAIRTILSKTVTIVLIVTFVRGPGDELAYAVIFSTGSLIGSLLGWVDLRKYVRLRFRGLDVKRHLRPLLPLLGFFMIASIYVNFDSVLLGLMSEEYNVGIYNVGMKTARMAITMIASMGIVLVPRFAFFLGSNRREEHLALAKRAIEFLYFLAFAGSAVLFFTAPALVPLIFGQQFAEAASTVRIAAPNILFVSLSGFLGMQILVPMGKESLLVWGTLAGGAASVVLGLLLIPHYQQAGSAIASVCAEFIVLLALIALAKRHGVDISFFDRRHLVYPLCSLAIAAPAALAGWIWGSASPVVLAAVGAGCVLYLLAFSWFRKDLAMELRALVLRLARRVTGN